MSCGESQPLNILITNKDRFDVTNIQALFIALKRAGRNVLLLGVSISRRFRFVSIIRQYGRLPHQHVSWLAISWSEKFLLEFLPWQW